jgi:hypothetical protein
MTLLNEIMPTYDRHEVHGYPVAASRAATWAAIRDLNGDQLRVMRLLMGMRTLGRRRQDSAGTVLDGFRRMGFRVVAEDPDRELVVAGIGRFWKLSGDLRRVEDREHFTHFVEPGYAKVAFNFHLRDGEISTETRIAGTDTYARRRFGLYWLLVRPGSGLIRHEWLRAIAKQAQATPDTAPSAPPRSA